MRGALVLAALLLAPGTAAPDEPFPSLSGSGLLTLPDVATLRPRRLTVSVAWDNRDRDPLGLDLADYALAWTLGLTRRAETYGRYVFSRVVALPEPPVLPPPPLDLIVPPGAAAPAPPYHSLYAPIPYVNKRGTARFGSFVPGDAVVGFKVRLRDPARWRPGVAAGAEVKLPLTRSLHDLQSGAGTGAFDAALRATAEWRRAGLSVVASAAYTRTGAPALGDRLLLSDGSGGAIDRPLSLPDQVDVGLGLRRSLGGRAAAVVELWSVSDVGRRTPVIDATRPLDVLAGLQLRPGRFRLTLGLRYHGHDLPSGALRSAPLAGFIDLTDVAPAALAGYLEAVGAGNALAGLRDRSQRVLVPGRLAAPLPPGARVIPATYRIRSEHQLGFVFVGGWAF